MRRSPSGSSKFLWVGIIGAVANLLYSVYRLRPWVDCVRVATTPLEHSRLHDLSGTYELLMDAARELPAGARVAIRSSSDDPFRNGMLQRFATGLMPDQRIGDARPGSATNCSSVAADADYVVVVGDGTPIACAQLLRRDGRGSIWRMRRR